MKQITPANDEATRKDLVNFILYKAGHLLDEETEHRFITYLEKQKEQKPNIELIQKSWYMEGYHDREFNLEPKWIIKTGDGGPKYEENPKYGQIIEQKPIEPSDDELQRHQKELYDFKVFAAKQAREHHISFVHDFEWNNFCDGLLSFFYEKHTTDGKALLHVAEKSYQIGLRDGRMEHEPVEWKPLPESMEALLLAIEGEWDAIKPTGYMSRRLEDLYDGLVNTFDVDEKYLDNLPKTAYTEKDIEEIKALKGKIDSSMEQNTEPFSCGHENGGDSEKQERRKANETA